MKRKRDLTTTDGESGLVSVWGFMFVIVLLGFTGLAFDVWHIWEARRDLTAAADAAATAGAGAVDEGAFRAFDDVRLWPPLAESYANESLDAQGDLPVLSQRIVTANIERVFIRLETEVDLTLMRLFTTTASIDVGADAVAVPYRSVPCSVAEPCPPPHTLPSGGGP